MTTTTTTHTRGPWTAHEIPTPGARRWTIADSSGNIPSIATVHDAAGCGEANARLIAAAPELLEQLKEARQYVAKVAAEKQEALRYTRLSLPGSGLPVATPVFASRRLQNMQRAIDQAEGV